MSFSACISHEGFVVFHELDPIDYNVVAHDAGDPEVAAKLRNLLQTKIPIANKDILHRIENSKKCHAEGAPSKRTSARGLGFAKRPFRISEKKNAFFDEKDVPLVRDLMLREVMKCGLSPRTIVVLDALMGEFHCKDGYDLVPEYQFWLLYIKAQNPSLDYAKKQQVENFRQQEMKFRLAASNALNAGATKKAETQTRAADQLRQQRLTLQAELGEPADTAVQTSATNQTPTAGPDTEPEIAVSMDDVKPAPSPMVAAGLGPGDTAPSGDHLLGSPPDLDVPQEGARPDQMEARLQVHTSEDQTQSPVSKTEEQEIVVPSSGGYSPVQPFPQELRPAAEPGAAAVTPARPGLYDPNGMPLGAQTMPQHLQSAQDLPTQTTLGVVPNTLSAGSVQGVQPMAAQNVPVYHSQEAAAASPSFIPSTVPAIGAPGAQQPLAAPQSGVIVHSAPMANSNVLNTQPVVVTNLTGATSVPAGAVPFPGAIAGVGVSPVNVSSITGPPPPNTPPISTPQERKQRKDYLDAHIAKFGAFQTNLGSLAVALKQEHTAAVNQRVARGEVSQKLVSLTKDSPLFPFTGGERNGGDSFSTVLAKQDQSAISFEDQFGATVVNNVVMWEAQVRGDLNAKVKATRDAHRQLEHYERKVEHLRAFKARVLANAKEYKPSAAEKLVRNEEKLTQSQRDYLACREKLDRCDEATNRSWMALYPLLVQLFQCEMSDAGERDNVKLGYHGLLEGITAAAKQQGFDLGTLDLAEAWRMLSSTDVDISACTRTDGSSAVSSEQQASIGSAESQSGNDAENEVGGTVPGAPLAGGESVEASRSDVYAPGRSAEPHQATYPEGDGSTRDQARGDVEYGGENVISVASLTTVSPAPHHSEAEVQGQPVDSIEPHQAHRVNAGSVDSQNESNGEKNEVEKVVSAGESPVPSRFDRDDYGTTGQPAEDQGGDDLENRAPDVFTASSPDNVPVGGKDSVEEEDNLSSSISQRRLGPSRSDSDGTDQPSSPMHTRSSRPTTHPSSFADPDPDSNVSIAYA